MSHLRDLFAAVCLREKKSASGRGYPKAGKPQPSTSRVRNYSELSNSSSSSDSDRKISHPNDSSTSLVSNKKKRQTEKIFEVVLSNSYKRYVFTETEILSKYNNQELYGLLFLNRITGVHQNTFSLEDFVENAHISDEWQHNDTQTAENIPMKITRLDEKKILITDNQGQRLDVDGEDVNFLIRRGVNYPVLVMGRMYLLNKFNDEFLDMIDVRDGNTIRLQNFWKNAEIGSIWYPNDLARRQGASPVQVSCVRKVDDKFLDSEYILWAYDTVENFSVVQQPELFFLVTGLDNEQYVYTLSGLVVIGPVEMFGVDVDANVASFSETLEAFALASTYGDVFEIGEARIERIKRIRPSVFKDSHYNRYRALSFIGVTSNRGRYEVVPDNPTVFLLTSTEGGPETRRVLSGQEIYERYNVNMVSSGQTLEEFLDTSSLGDTWVMPNLCIENVEQIDETSFRTLRNENWKYRHPESGNRDVIEKRNFEETFFLHKDGGFNFVYSRSYLFQNLPKSELDESMRSHLIRSEVGSSHLRYRCIKGMRDIFFKRAEGRKLERGSAFPTRDMFYVITETVENGKYNVEPVSLNMVFDAPSGYEKKNIFRFIRDRQTRRMLPIQKDDIRKNDIQDFLLNALKYGTMKQYLEFVSPPPQDNDDQLRLIENIYKLGFAKEYVQSRRFEDKEKIYLELYGYQLLARILFEKIDLRFHYFSPMKISKFPEHQQELLRKYVQFIDEIEL